MLKTIGNGCYLRQPGDEDLSVLIERLYAQREDRSWLSAENTELAAMMWPSEELEIKRKSLELSRWLSRAGRDP